MSERQGSLIAFQKASLSKDSSLCEGAERLHPDKPTEGNWVQASLFQKHKRDVVDVEIEGAERAIRTDDWRLGYSMTVHSSQGLTIHNPQKVWIIHDYLQWCNLAYLVTTYCSSKSSKK